MLLWGKKPEGFEFKILEPEEIMRKHFSEEDIIKIQSMDAIYSGINDSINTGIENTRNFIKGVANTCPNRNCPVKSVLCDCDQCEEKSCRGINKEYAMKSVEEITKKINIEDFK
jgi:hypothetical protein